MRWEDERYVRSYTRDTLDWLALSFEAQGLLQLILRKVDRAGIIRLGRHGPKGVAAIVGHADRWKKMIEPALNELLADGCVVIQGNALVLPNFISAQETPTSDAQRQRDKRERDKDKALAKDLKLVTQDSHEDESRHDVTQERHVGASHEGVTAGNAGAVTPNHPNHPSVPKEAGPAAPAAAALARKINDEWPDLKAEPEAAEAWGRAFPGINLAAETRLARAHWASNGPSRKQGDFPTAFLNRWFRTTSQGSSFLRPQARGAAQLQINEEAKAEHAVPGRKIL